MTVAQGDTGKWAGKERWVTAPLRGISGRSAVPALGHKPRRSLFRRLLRRPLRVELLQGLVAPYRKHRTATHRWGTLPIPAYAQIRPPAHIAIQWRPAPIRSLGAGTPARLGQGLRTYGCRGGPRSCLGAVAAVVGPQQQPGCSPGRQSEGVEQSLRLSLC